MNGGRKSKPRNSSLQKIYHLFGRICLELSAHAARVNTLADLFQFFSVLSDFKML
jgi:hypothetical protein